MKVETGVDFSQFEDWTGVWLEEAGEVTEIWNRSVPQHEIYHQIPHLEFLDPVIPPLHPDPGPNVDFLDINAEFSRR